MTFEVEPQWLWLIVAALLAIAELIAPGLFLVFLAAAAALTGVAALLFGLSLPFQLALFPLFALATLLAGRRWYHDSDVESADPLLNDRAARYIGQTVTVVRPIQNGEGRVKVADGVWPATGPDAPLGAQVRIVGAEGTCLKVEASPTPLPE